MNGSDKDIARLLQMRDNCAFYCAILDLYAPPVVSVRGWNNDTNMATYCASNDYRVFGRHVLSISDEAFILLVLVNASARWMADVHSKQQMVSALSTRH